MRNNISVGFKFKNDDIFRWICDSIFIGPNKKPSSLFNFFEFTIMEERATKFVNDVSTYKDFILSMKKKTTVQELILEEVDEVKIKDHRENKTYHLKLNPHLLNLGIKEFYLESVANAQ